MKMNLQHFKKVRYYNTFRTIWLLCTITAISISGCGKKDEAAQDQAGVPPSGSFSHIYQNQEPFKDWVRDRYDNVVFIHPPNHLHQEKFPEVAKIFSALAKQTCLFLRLEPPDSLVIYFYTGVGQGLTITQRSTPFSDGKVIHFWFPSYYGPPIVKHLLPKWSKVEPRHKFLKDGIIALLDGTTNNYHEATLKFIDSGTFIPLRRLAVDTTINVDMERHQSAEAASFVDYIVYAYDVNYLKQLYESQGGFSAEVEHIFMLKIPKLEEQWLTFVHTFGGQKAPVKK